MPTARKPSDIIALQVRLAESLRRKLATAAEKSGRSLNSEILWRLGQTFDEPEHWEASEKDRLRKLEDMVAELAAERRAKRAS
jgi:hypothetical protein